MNVKKVGRRKMIAVRISCREFCLAREPRSGRLFGAILVLEVLLIAYSLLLPFRCTNDDSDDPQERAVNSPQAWTKTVYPSIFIPGLIPIRMHIEDGEALGWHVLI